MSKYAEFDAAFQQTETPSPSGWMNITDGDHTAILKEARVESNQYGPSVLGSFYYPKFNASEFFRFSPDTNPDSVRARIFKRNMSILSPASQTLEDLEKTLPTLNEGKVTVRRKTSTKINPKTEKGYVNHDILEFTPPPSPASGKTSF